MNTPEPSRAAATQFTTQNGQPPISRALSLLLWTGVLAIVFLAHYLPSLDATGPVVFEDELGYLANAKAIASVGAQPALGRMGFYHAGWSLLLAPLWWVFGEPGLVYRSGLVLTAVLGAAHVVPLAWLGRNIFGVNCRLAVAMAGAIAAYTGHALMSSYLYAEALFAVLFTTLVVAGFSWHQRPTAWRGTCLGLLASFTYLTHGRALFIPVVTLGWLAIRGLRQRTVRLWLPGALALVAVVVGTVILHKWLERSIYDLAFDRLGLGVSRLGSIRPRALLTAVLGQIWYGGAAWLGLGFAGLAALAYPGRAKFEIAGGRSPTIWWLALVTTVVAVSMLSFEPAIRNEPIRLDYFAYGRHVDAVLPAVAMAGLAGLASGNSSRRKVAALAGAVIAAGALFMVVAGTSRITDRPVAALSLAGIAHFIEPGAQRLPWFEATVAAVLGASLVGLTLRRWKWVGVAMLWSLFVISTGIGEVRAMQPLDRPWRDLITLRFIVNELDPAVVGFDTNRGGLYSRNGHQFWSPLSEFEFFDGSFEYPHAALVISRREWEVGRAAGARRLAGEPRLNDGLWVMPGLMQDQLAAIGYLEPSDTTTELPSDAYRADLYTEPVARSTIQALPGEEVAVRLHIGHAGNGAPWAAWGTLPDSQVGTVRVVAFWVGSSQTSSQFFELPRTLFPAEHIEMTLDLVVPDFGPQLLRIGLVHEGVRLFSPPGEESLQYPISAHQ
ncbi:MAG: hypothetical protein WD651_12815 [Acidimicrobiia bacterium]